MMPPSTAESMFCTEGRYPIPVRGGQAMICVNDMSEPTHMPLSSPNVSQLRAQVVPQEPEQPEPPTQVATPAECEATCTHHRPVRLSWAKLLKRVFEIDLENCPNCGGALKIIVAIMVRPVIEKILTHLNLQARASPRAPALRSQLQAPCVRSCANNQASYGQTIVSLADSTLDRSNIERRSEVPTIGAQP